MLMKIRKLLIWLLKELQDIKPDIRIFMDRMNLDTGIAWQPEIFEAIDFCKKNAQLYFHPLTWILKVCKEEFNIAWARGRDNDENSIFPIYLYTSELPAYMKYRLYVDCREYDENKLHEACASFISLLSKSKDDFLKTWV